MSFLFYICYVGHPTTAANCSHSKASCLSESLTCPTRWQGSGLMSFSGHFEHHQNSHICWRWNIPIFVGWCETSGHRNIPTPKDEGDFTDASALSGSFARKCQSDVSTRAPWGSSVSWCGPLGVRYGNYAGPGMLILDSWAKSIYEHI